MIWNPETIFELWLFGPVVVAFAIVTVIMFIDIVFYLDGKVLDKAQKLTDTKAFEVFMITWYSPFLIFALVAIVALIIGTTLLSPFGYLLYRISRIGRSHKKFRDYNALFMLCLDLSERILVSTTSFTVKIINALGFGGEK